MKKLFDKNYYNYYAKLLLVVKFYRNNLNILKPAVAVISVGYRMEASL